MYMYVNNSQKFIFYNFQIHFHTSTVLVSYMNIQGWSSTTRYCAVHTPRPYIYTNVKWQILRGEFNTLLYDDIFVTESEGSTFKAIFTSLTQNSHYKRGNFIAAQPCQPGIKKIVNHLPSWLEAWNTCMAVLGNDNLKYGSFIITYQCILVLNQECLPSTSVAWVWWKALHCSSIEPRTPWHKCHIDLWLECVVRYQNVTLLRHCQTSHVPFMYCIFTP